MVEGAWNGGRAGEPRVEDEARPLMAVVYLGGRDDDVGGLRERGLEARRQPPELGGQQQLFERPEAGAGVVDLSERAADLEDVGDS